MPPENPSHVLLRVEGEVARPLDLRFADFARVAAEHQIDDVSRIDPKRQGAAVTLAGLLNLVGASPAAKYLSLHSSTDDFHASIPLEAVRDRAILIYRLASDPLPTSAGGPIRFYIPDFAACHTAEVDECANVKFVDRIELSSERGRDNRPSTLAEHERLHEAERARQGDGPRQGDKEKGR